MKKVTGPEHLKANLTKLDEALKHIEFLFESEPKGKTVYKLHVPMHLNDETICKVNNIYMKAGWDNVIGSTTGPGMTTFLFHTKIE